MGQGWGLRGRPRALRLHPFLPGQSGMWMESALWSGRALRLFLPEEQLRLGILSLAPGGPDERQCTLLRWLSMITGQP